MKRLIVTADDLGLSSEINTSVLKAHVDGLVTSASIIVGAPAWREAVVAAKKHPNLSLGLHLCFVQGVPVSDPKDIPSLVGNNGCFVDSALHLMARRPVHSELLSEARAQMDAFIEAVGRPPSFINTHQHTQLLPRVRNVVIEVCRQYEVKAVRLPAEQQPLRPNGRLRSWLWPVATGAALFSRTHLRRAGLQFPDRMLGGPESGRLTHRTLSLLVEQVEQGTTELVVHPTGNSEELDALLSPHIARRLDHAGVERIGFDVL